MDKVQLSQSKVQFGRKPVIYAKENRVNRVLLCQEKLDLNVQIIENKSRILHIVMFVNQMQTKIVFN